MMSEQFQRTEMLIGIENIDKLNHSTVAIFGLGGVGSFVVEGLARAGVGKFILIDSDTVSISNINRQIIATYKTVGRPKVEVAKERILDINPSAIVEIHQDYFTPKSEDFFDKYVDYVIDCIDTITSKINLVERANKLKIPIISCMGTGNKLDPTKFEIADIYKTSVCPMAKVMRKELRQRGIDKLKVLYSKEEPAEHKQLVENGKQVPASISFVPSVAGLIITAEVVKDLISVKGK